MRKSLLGAAILLLVAAAAAPPPERHDPDFVVFRPVSTDSAAGTATATLDGKTYYFDAAQWLLDLRDIDVNACKAQEGPYGWQISGKLTPEGGRTMAKWTEANINKQLGIFVDGTLVSAPFIRSKIEDAFIIEGTFTMAEAQHLVRRMRHGLK